MGFDDDGDDAALIDRSRHPVGPRTVDASIFAAGYLLVWAATGVPVYEAAVAAGRLSQEHTTAATATAVALFVVAGLYQLSVPKQRCLDRCRLRLSFAHARGTALGRGVGHGGWCVACSWATMALLIAAGVMNLFAMAAISLVLYGERHLFPGRTFRAWPGSGSSSLLLWSPCTRRPPQACTACPQAACPTCDRYLVGVAVSPHIRRLREKVGHDLLVLPAVCVLPIDPAGRLLLVEEIETGQWQTIGGSIEPHEAPRDAGVREAFEEAGVVVELGRLIDSLGGPGFEVTYPNGDVVSYVTSVFEAVVRIRRAEPRWRRDERSRLVGLDELDDLGRVPLSAFTQVLFGALPMGELLVPRARSSS